MARFPSIDSQGRFEAPEVQNSIKELVTGSTDGITVDTSVGTRVYVGDTMIHGDTGWRDVSFTLDESDVISGSVQIKRENDIVFLRFNAIILRPGTGYRNVMRYTAVLDGFRIRNRSGNINGSLFIDNNAVLEYGISIFNSSVYFTKRLTGSEVDQVIPEEELFGTLIYSPTDSWPTTLPGTPA